MIYRYIYSVFGPLASVNRIDTTLSKQAKKFVYPVLSPEYSKDRKSFTVFVGGQRIVYSSKPMKP